MRDEIKEKRPGLLRRKVLFHQENARDHTSVQSMAEIHQSGFESLPHPPYSPDLAPSDFYMLPYLKKILGGKLFSTIEEVIAAVDAYFEELDEDFFKTGIEALPDRWKKCFELGEEYVEQ